MKFYAASLIWVIVAAVLGYGLWKFSHGASAWFIAIPVIVFTIILARTGYRTD